MSLVLTELSFHGVAMAADSAFTMCDRDFTGFQKLLPVYPINAGLSMWGLANIDDTDLDIWLEKFIEDEVKEDMSLWDMANKLANQLNKTFKGIIDERMGIHVAGYDLENEVRSPAFYHVHNGHYHVEFKNGESIDVPEEDPPIREFKAHKDSPPRVYSGFGDFRLTRNGDFGIFAFLSENLNRILLDIQRATGLTFPFPNTLSARGEYLRFLINITKEIYRLSNYRSMSLPEPPTAGSAHIGGDVFVLTISDKGIQDFYCK